MTRLLFIIALGITITTACCQSESENMGKSKSQWKLEEIKDDRGDPSGRFVALSPWTSSVSGEGQILRLRVGHSFVRSASIIQSEADVINLAGGEQSAYGLGPRLKFPLEDDAFQIYSLAVIINGRKEEWSGSWTEKYGSPDMLELYSPYEPTSGCNVGPVEASGGARWAQASRLKIIVPTRGWGDLIYDSDMTGAKKAIAKTFDDR